MLGKLIKHDFKALSRYLLLLHAAALVLTLIGRFFVAIASDQRETPSAILGIYLVVLILFLIVTMIATAVITAVHFYRSLFSRQGYLTWSLPATAGQHLFSKTVTGFLWYAASILINTGCIAFLFASASYSADWSEAENLFQKNLGISLTSFFLYLVIAGIIGCFSSLLSIYVSIAVGQLFSNHRVLGAFISYAIISTLVQIVTGFSMIGSLVPLGRVNGSMVEMSVNTNLLGSYISRQMLFVIILSLIQGVIFYLVTYYIMRKKINLQ